MVASPSPWNYRNHVQFHLTEEGKLGYVNGAGCQRYLPSLNVICLKDSINSLWPQLEFEPEMDIERVSLRAGVNG